MPLISPDKQSAAIRSKLSAKEDALVAELGGNVLKSTIWRTGLGQIGLYVAPGGLSQLAASPHVRSFGRDMTADTRAGVYGADGRLARIEAEIERAGYADVEIVQNLDNLEFDIGTDGRIAHRLTSAQATEIASKRLSLLKRLPLQGVLDIAQAIAKASSGPLLPTFNLRINKEGLFHLKEHAEVRGMRLAGDPDVTAAHLDPEALAAARKDGYAEVLIDLQRFPGYSPLQGKLPAQAWRAQDAAIKVAFAQILNRVEPSISGTAKNFEGLASMSVRLSRAGIEQLYQAPDPRILGIFLSKPRAVPALAQSTVLTNMPQAWNIGLKGSGQYVAILDSGVESTHPFLQTSGGQSKVIAEGCAGTNNSDWYSFCPNQDAQGDSVGAGAAHPCPTTTFDIYCAHGTHVAGIATGRPNGGPAGVSGEAPDAQIIAMQVFSGSRTTANIGAFDADLARALEVAWQIGYTNLTVNMSIGSVQTGYTVTCDNVFMFSYTFSDSIARLKSMGVPVVVSTGNSGWRDRISFPACLNDVIKVPSVDDVTGEISSFSNLADPAYFAGPWLLAPGSVITSSLAYTPGRGYPYENISGTSMAAPHVAGMAAVIKAQLPGVTVDTLTSWLYGNGVAVTPLPGYPYTSSLKRVRMPDF